MRYTWVDFGNDPAWDVIAPHAINGLFFHLYDPRLNAGYLDGVRRRGPAVGIYAADSWGPIGDGSGAEAAREVDAQVRRIVPNATPAFPKVQLDLERHDPGWILDCLREWRRLRPKQDTSWTFEPMQGGWMDRETFVKPLLSLRVRLVPQTYGGSMQRFAEDVVLRDLTRRGVPEHVVSPFYDAAALPIGWDGYAFTQGRLPR